jgi:hypothetical protein
MYTVLEMHFVYIFLDFLEDSGGEEEDEEEESESLSDSSDAEFNSEFRKYKANYYTDKMDFKRVTQYVVFLEPSCILIY